MKKLPTELSGRKIRVNKSYKGLSLGEPSKIAGQVFTIKSVDWADNTKDKKPTFKIEHESIQGYNFTWLGAKHFTLI